MESRRFVICSQKAGLMIDIAVRFLIIPPGSGIKVEKCDLLFTKIWELFFRHGKRKTKNQKLFTRIRNFNWVTPLPTANLLHVAFGRAQFNVSEDIIYSTASNWGKGFDASRHAYQDSHDFSVDTDYRILYAWSTRQLSFLSSNSFLWEGCTVFS